MWISSSCISLFVLLLADFAGSLTYNCYATTFAMADRSNPCVSHHCQVTRCKKPRNLLSSSISFAIDVLLCSDKHNVWPEDSHTHLSTSDPKNAWQNLQRNFYLLRSTPPQIFILSWKSGVLWKKSQLCIPLRNLIPPPPELVGWGVKTVPGGGQAEGGHVTSSGKNGGRLST